MAAHNTKTMNEFELLMCRYGQTERNSAAGLWVKCKTSGTAIWKDVILLQIKENLKIILLEIHLLTSTWCGFGRAAHGSSC